MVWDMCISSNLDPLTEFRNSSSSTRVERYPPMEHLSNDHEDHPSLQENSHSLYDEKGHLILGLKKGQWKLRQQYDQNSLMEGKPL